MSKRATSQTGNEFPNLPTALAPLRELAFNLWWSWDVEARALFAGVDAERWERLEHNPIALMRRVPARRWQQLADDAAFLRRVKRVHRRFLAYLKQRTWFAKKHGRALRGGVAYFSMEFGLHESLPIYAGGLGVLAGDHFKSASDLGLPLVGVGMFWRRGYVRQRIEADGTQGHAYDTLKPEQMPFIEVTTPAGQPLRLEVPVGDTTVQARAWRLDVGRVPIFFLDTYLPENAPKHRRLTEGLYIGDRDSRIRQELVLGVGGWKLMRALELPVRVCHLNEGHAVFCNLERIEEGLAEGQTLAEAKRAVSRTTVFTTHTPVPAGNEAFDPQLAQKYLSPYCARTGLEWEKLLAWSRVDPADGQESFGLTPLALRLANKRNGVSQLHGEVSRKMWNGVWPDREASKVPIGAITNGVHTDTWMHPEMATFLDAYLPEGWRLEQDRAATWRAIDRIPAEELWNLHVSLKQQLIAFVRERQQRRLDRLGASKRAMAEADLNLDENALTIGFARRFAPYKRATLIFSNLRRLTAMTKDKDRPVQFIFAGKAHPADTEGQALVAEVAKYAADARFGGRIVILEDYDMPIARHLVSGVDVWLNNPRRPHEASGTSGMKPALHGGLNLSILDGWWPEACAPGRNGWAIGKAVDHRGTKADDRADALSLYDTLEKKVIPLYYRRDRAGVPQAWITCMKHALRTIPVAFNSHRMVKEYLSKYYAPMLKK
jgi:starch phosphorylase